MAGQLFSSLAMAADRVGHPQDGSPPAATGLDALVGRRFYEPSESGAEATLKRRLDELRTRERQESEPGGEG
jgi:hypothetical protein